MKIILSCTTTYERRGIFYYGVQSLLKQSLKPDIFLVNISKEKYLNDSGFPNKPNWLDKEGIEINWVPNTGPYRKLLPAISIAQPDDLIITADDDVLYHVNWLNQLVGLHKEYPDYITCSRARRIDSNIFGIWKNYNSWSYVEEKNANILNVPIGCGGTLYTKRLIDLDFLFDKKYLEIAPTTDDLWFKKASMIKQKEVLVEPKIDRENIYLRHMKGMYQRNAGNFKFQSSIIPNSLINYLGINSNKNDINWEKINQYSVDKYGV